MPKKVISDTSCLIVLDNIAELYLLQNLYEQITITHEIQEEFGKELPTWIRVENAQNEEFKKSLTKVLDKGEASAVALALENIESLLILDDLKARKIAKELGLTQTGTLGVLMKAKQAQYVPKLKPILEKLKAINFQKKLSKKF